MSASTMSRSTIEGSVKKPVSKGTRFSINGFVQSIKAKKQAKKIIAAIHEAEEIHAGRKPAKSLDDLLAEL